LEVPRKSNFGPSEVNNKFKSSQGKVIETAGLVLDGIVKHKMDIGGSMKVEHFAFVNFRLESEPIYQINDYTL
jgi:hypothetical protein